MTAKRFKFNGRNNCIEYDGKSILLDSYGEDIEELLNELHEENKELKRLVKATVEDYTNLKQSFDLINEKNEHLQQQNKRLEYKIQRERISFAKTHKRWSKEAENKIKKLSEENEELKRELQTYRKVAGCFNCRYHNYDWYDDGDEFEVCDIGNDVTEGICEKWEEL